MNEKEDENNANEEPVLYEHGAHFSYKQLYERLEKITSHKSEKDVEIVNIARKNYPQSRNINYFSYINQEEDRNEDFQNFEKDNLDDFTSNKSNFVKEIYIHSNNHSKENRNQNINLSIKTEKINKIKNGNQKLTNSVYTKKISQKQGLVASSYLTINQKTQKKKNENKIFKEIEIKRPIKTSGILKMNTKEGRSNSKKNDK